MIYAFVQNILGSNPMGTFSILLIKLLIIKNSTSKYMVKICMIGMKTQIQKNLAVIAKK